MSEVHPYLVGVKGKRVTGVLGPYTDAEVQAPIRGEQTLRDEGADEVYAVRADSIAAARAKVQREIK